MKNLFLKATATPNKAGGLSGQVPEAILARQQIIDKHDRLYGYELLYRPIDSNMNVTHDHTASDIATFTVVANLLNDFGVNEILGGKKGFINVDHESIFATALETLPADKIILELLETTIVNRELIGRVNQLYKLGYRFAIDDFVISSQNIEYFRPLFPFTKIIKIDVMANSLEDIEDKIHFFEKEKKQLLAEKVETIEEYEKLKQLGFQFFQGYFFAKPEVKKTKKMSVSQQGIMQVITKVEKRAETNEIEEVFKHYPDLSINLLKLVNSSAMGIPNKIRDIRQALTMLGREKLASWTMLMMYSQGSTRFAVPLIQFTAIRARMMSKLISYFKPESKRSDQDRAFLTGLMSNSHILLGIEIDEVINRFNLNDDISDALSKKAGVLGTLLTFVEHFDKNDFEEIQVQMSKVGISPDLLHGVFLDSARWASQLQQV